MTPPEGKIPFSEFIVNDDAENGSFLYYTWFDRHEFVVRAGLDIENEAFGLILKDFHDRDDWMFSAGWGFRGYYAHITRGPRRLRFTVRGSEALALLKIQDRLRAAAKAKRKEAKLAAKKRLDAARWWP